MFFSKPLKQVTYEDVQEFCKAKIKENEVLDYKEDFPAKLEKILAAFANTYGGLIIIGVPELDGKPVDNPGGISYQTGLEEKVTSIILSNITPPIFPEIQVCNPVNDKTFVLIQIPQSSNTPHAVENNTKVYLRTGNISQPEKLANLDELHWLSRNRQNAVMLRHDLVSNAMDRYYSLCKYKKATIEFAELQAYIIPIYPNSNLGLIERINTNMSNLVVNDKFGSIFPSIHKGVFQTVKDGISLFVNIKNERGEKTEYTVINSYGLVLHNEDLGMFSGQKDIKTFKTIYLSHVIDAYVSLLKFYKKILPDLKVWGDFMVRLALVKLEEVLPVSILQDPHFQPDNQQIYDKAYIYEETLSLNDLNSLEKLNQKLVEFILDLHWSFGVPIQEAGCKTWIQSNVNWDI